MFTNLYEILTFLVVLTAIFSYVNVRFIKLAYDDRHYADFTDLFTVGYLAG